MRHELELALRRVEATIHRELVVREPPYTMVALTYLLDPAGEWHVEHGFAKCSPRDEFSNGIGEAVAEGRARKRIAEAALRWYEERGINLELFDCVAGLVDAMKTIGDAFAKIAPATAEAVREEQ